MAELEGTIAPAIGVAVHSERFGQLAASLLLRDYRWDRPAIGRWAHLGSTTGIAQYGAITVLGPFARVRSRGVSAATFGWSAPDSAPVSNMSDI